MKGVQLWQHPYVDVFKYTAIQEWRQCSKEGDVSELIDKTLGKKVFKLQGSVSASNYIQIPRPKAELKSLSLNGKYVYVIIQVPPGKLFSLHLDLIAVNTRTNLEENLKITLSNLFKENKLQNSLQVSCKIAGKWSVICVDLKNLIIEYFADRLVHKELRSINLCANMTVRGVYTSDIMYSPKTMPKEIALKSPKIEDWSKFYDWLFIPEKFADENWERAEEIQIPVRSSSLNKKEVKKVDFVEKNKTKNNLKTVRTKAEVLNQQSKQSLNQKPEEDSKLPKAPKEAKEEIKKPAEPNQDVQISKPKVAVLQESPNKPNGKPPKAETNKRIPGKITKTMKKSNSEPKLDLPQEVNDKLLHPDPILELSNILSVSAFPYSILWVPADFFSSYSAEFKEGTNKILVYTSNSTIVAINPINLKKTFYFAHNSKVTALGLHQQFLVSSDESCMILFWPIKSRKRPVPLSIKKFKEIRFFSFFAQKMVISGKDDLKRDSLVIYDTSKLTKRRELIHVTSQLSDFDLKVIKFYEDSKLISCGKEGIRVWFHKDDRYSSSSIPILDKDECNCTDLDLTAKKAYVSNTKSSILQVNLQSKEIESITSLTTQGITRIKILEDIVMTCSSDCFVRFWPLNFQEVYMEVQHKSKVISADMLGTNAATLTDNGVLISIDLSNSSLSSLSKNYPNAVHVSAACKKFCIITNTISVLTEDFLPVCEFTSAKDDPKVALVSSDGSLIVCGFFSGAVRVFDIQSLQLIDEFHHLKAPIERLELSRNGKVLIAIAEDGNYSVFDGNSKFQPVKDGKIDVPCTFAAAFSQDCRYLALVCQFGMSVAVFETCPLAQRFKVNLLSPVLDVRFAGNLLLGLLAEPNQMNYYAVIDNKLVNTKQILLPSALTKFTVSACSSYIAGVSPDNSLKIFDLYFSLPCQTFLGHCSEVKELIWCDSTIITLSEKDGALFWLFKGQFSGQADAEDSDYIEELSQESEEPVQIDVEREVEAYLRHVENITTNMMVSSSPSLSYLFGYSPNLHNVYWSPAKSFLTYTVGAIVVKTMLLGEKKQILMHGHYNSITATALSPDSSFLATAEGNASFAGMAKIHVWNLETCKLAKVLEFHEKSVNCLAFSPCSSFLCSVGSDPEPTLVVWELVLNRPIVTSVLPAPGVQVKWLPQLSLLEFVTITSSSVVFWRLNTLKRLEFQPGEELSQGLSCVEYSPYFEDLASHLLLVGCAGGAVAVLNVRTNTLVQNKQLVKGKVSIICSTSKAVFVAGEAAEVLRWHWQDGVFAGPPEKVLFDGVPVSLCFNDEGREGTVATAAGSIWYVEWENGTVRIISSHVSEITCVTASDVLATAALDHSIRVWNPMTLEQTSHIFVPNVTCTCLAFHQTFPYLLAGFSDGSIKAFETSSNRCLGSSRGLMTSATCLAFTSDSDCALVGCESGVVLAVLVARWSPLTVSFYEFSSLSSCILSVDCRERCCLATTNAGLVHVWEKKLTGEKSERFLGQGQEFNLIDLFDFKEPFERTNHVFLQAESLECKARFDGISDKTVWIIIRGAQYLIQRNFYSHAIVRKINLAGFPLCIDVCEHRIAVGLADRRVLVYADGNIHEFLTHSAPVAQVKLAGKGLATVSGNEIGYWTVG